MTAREEFPLDWSIFGKPATRPVTRRAPCPCCDRTHWCRVHNHPDPLYCVCTAFVMTSDKHAPRFAPANRRNGGRWDWANGQGTMVWLRDPPAWVYAKGQQHSGRKATPRRSPERQLQQRRDAAAEEVPNDSVDWASLQAGFTRAMSADERVARFADSIRAENGVRSLTVEALRSFGVGYCAEKRCVSFPMYGPGMHRVVGIRLRPRRGKKFCVEGSYNGVFLPRAFSGAGGPLWVPEGETDASAFRSMGEDSIGRTNANARWEWVMAHAHGRPLRIVADIDGGHLAGLAAAVQGVRHIREDYGYSETTLWRPPDGLKDSRQMYELGGGIGDMVQVSKPEAQRAIDAWEEHKRKHQPVAGCHRYGRERGAQERLFKEVAL